MCYLAGEELRQRGDLELAKTYFRRALIGPLMQSQFSTLAGDRHCQMNDWGNRGPTRTNWMPTQCGLRLNPMASRPLKVQPHCL